MKLALRVFKDFLRFCWLCIIFLPRWIILTLIIVFTLIVVAQVFPAPVPKDTTSSLPKEVTDLVRFLAHEEYDSIGPFCTDTVLIGRAFTGDCLVMSKEEMVVFLKSYGLLFENRNVFRRFPRGFQIDLDKERRMFTFYQFSKPQACLQFEQIEGKWKLEILGLYFSESEKNEQANK